MKKIIIFSIILIFPLWVSAEKNAPLGKVTYISGKGYVKAKSREEWTELKMEMAIHDLDSIKTESNSRCEISFQKKKVIRIDENTDIDITNVVKDIDKVTITKGDIWLSVHMPDIQSAIVLESPSTACSIRGTVYRLSCNDNLTAYKCYQGKIDVTPTVNKNTTAPENSYPVISGEELVIVIDFEKYKQLETRAFLDYFKKTHGDFELYKEKQKLEFQQSLQKAWSDFKEMDGFYVKQSKFDEEKEMAVDWVHWNLERDRMMMAE